MSIYHCTIKIINRSNGRSAVASAAYRSGEKLYNEETGITYDFTKKGGVVFSEILLPENAPKEYLEREILWNEVQRVEKRADAQFAREIEVAFPNEMKREEQIECIRNYISTNFVKEGMIADWALHDKGDGNPHAHIMLTVRGFDENKKWLAKQRTVFANARDDLGRAIYDPNLPSYNSKDEEHTYIYRIPVLDEYGMQKVRIREGKGVEKLWEKITIPSNDWNERYQAEKWRASWAEHCNRYLAPENQIDHRSYVRQGIEKVPTIHEGFIARTIEKEGKVAERCQINRDIKEWELVKVQLRTVAKEISTLVLERAKSLYDRYREFARNYRDSKQSKSDVEYSGDAAERKREADFINEKLGRTIGRIHEFKRAAKETDRTIAETDKTIREIAERKENINERLQRLRQRAGNSRVDGEDTGAERNPAEGKGANEYGEFRAVREDISSFIEHLRVKERSAEEKRDNSISERAYRSVEQRRQNVERGKGENERS